MAQLSKPALARLKPYERTPSGRIKNYYDPDTKYVWSARQYRQARAGGVRGETVTALRSSGQDNVSIFRTAQKRGERIEWLLNAYQDREFAETGKRRSKREILQDDSFWKSVDGLSHERSRSPKGIRARALEDFGVRPREASWKVGESPKKKRR